MKDRIILLIKAKNLTAAQFADQIGVQKSGISHIISGRNNASLDFIQKILIRYPEVNMEWLMFGKGPLFKENESLGDKLAETDREITNTSSVLDLFSSTDSDFTPSTTNNPQGNINKRVPQYNEKPFELIENKLNTSERSVKSGVSNSNPHNSLNVQSKKIVKIVEFYADNTFSEYFPE